MKKVLILFIYIIFFLSGGFVVNAENYEININSYNIGNFKKDFGGTSTLLERNIEKQNNKIEEYLEKKLAKQYEKIKIDTAAKEADISEEYIEKSNNLEKIYLGKYRVKDISSLKNTYPVFYDQYKEKKLLLDDELNYALEALKSTEYQKLKEIEKKSENLKTDINGIKTIRDRDSLRNIQEANTLSQNKQIERLSANLKDIDTEIQTKQSQINSSSTDPKTVKRNNELESEITKLKLKREGLELQKEVSEKDRIYKNDLAVKEKYENDVKNADDNLRNIESIEKSLDTPKSYKDVANKLGIDIKKEGKDIADNEIKEKVEAQLKEEKAKAKKNKETATKNLEKSKEILKTSEDERLKSFMKLMDRSVSKTSKESFNLTKLGGTFLSQGNFDTKKGVIGVIENILKYLIFAAGILAVLGVSVGGVMIMTGGADDNMLQNGKNAIFYSVIGIIIVLLSYVLISTVQSIIYGISNI